MACSTASKIFPQPHLTSLMKSWLNFNYSILHSSAFFYSQILYCNMISNHSPPKKKFKNPMLYIQTVVGLPCQTKKFIMKSRVSRGKRGKRVSHSRLQDPTTRLRNVQELHQLFLLRSSDKWPDGPLVSMMVNSCCLKRTNGWKCTVDFLFLNV